MPAGSNTGLRSLLRARRDPLERRIAVHVSPENLGPAGAVSTVEHGVAGVIDASAEDRLRDGGKRRTLRNNRGQERAAETLLTSCGRCQRWFVGEQHHRLRAVNL